MEQQQQPQPQTQPQLNKDNFTSPAPNATHQSPCSSNFSINISSYDTNCTAEEMWAGDLHDELHAIFLAVMFCISAVTNLSALYKLTVGYKGQRRKYSIFWGPLINLCVADIIITAFGMGGTAAWLFTSSWLAGDFMCRLVKYVQVLGNNASTYLIMFISVDRAFAVCRPMTNISSARCRIRCFLITAWVLAAVGSLPQWFMFSAVQAPPPFEPGYYQCYSLLLDENIELSVYYSLIVCIFSFIIPFIVMIIAYTIILVILRKKYREHPTSRFDSDRRTSHTEIRQCKISTAVRPTTLLTNESATKSMTTNGAKTGSKITTSSDFSSRERKLSNSIRSSKSGSMSGSNGSVNGKSIKDTSPLQRSTSSYKNPSPTKSGDARPREASVQTSDGSFMGNRRNTSTSLTKKYIKVHHAHDENRIALMKRAKHKSMKTFLIIITSFIICWIPYYSFFLVFTVRNYVRYLKFQREGGVTAEAVHGDNDLLIEEVADWTSMFAMLSPLINPLIYGSFSFQIICSKVRKATSSTKSRFTVTMNRRTNNFTTVR